MSSLVFQRGDKLRVTKDVRGHRKGQILTPDRGVADLWLRQGWVELVQESDEAKPNRKFKRQ